MSRQIESELIVNADTYRYQQHRFWRNTPMIASQPGRGDAPAVLLKGILGHEWDEDIDNGFRPAVRFLCLSYHSLAPPTQRPSPRPFLPRAPSLTLV